MPYELLRRAVPGLPAALENLSALQSRCLLEKRLFAKFVIGCWVMWMPARYC